jgi:hypothetical protein
VSRVIRSRRTSASQDQPLYARLLRLRHLAPSGFLCFVFLEGAAALGILLALAELVSWWGVLVLPATVAAMVKLNDLIAGMLARPAAAAPRTGPAAAATAAGSPALRPATMRPEAVADYDSWLRGARTVDLHQRAMGPLPSMTGNPEAMNRPPASRQSAQRSEAFQQMARQSATRRYE